LTVKQALVCHPIPTKGWCTEDRPRSDGVFAKSLGQLSLAGRPVGTAYTPRSQVPSQYGYDESLLPTSVLHPFKGLARRTINSSGSSTVQIDSNLTSPKVELIQNFVEKRQVLGEADGC
jgi:hypothetical protein